MNFPLLYKHVAIWRSINRHNILFGVSRSLTYHEKEKFLRKEETSTDNNNLTRHQPKFNTPTKKYKFRQKVPEHELLGVISSNKNNPDNFGTLNDDWEFVQQLAALPEEKDDVVEKEYLHNRIGKNRLTTNKYGKLIKEFINQRKIGLAIEVLETRMLKEDKVQPESYIYNLLIGACGQVGYSKKAFKLYKQMRDRGLKITGHVYTGLFNACANSPFPDNELRRALQLRAVMVEKAVLMNQTIYHAMIKAFGRCGDMETAFMLVDEMLENNIMVSNDTFNFLLQACITDKTTGFSQALLVWQKMMQKRIRPSLFSFNLMLRCSRDCGMGDEASCQQIIQVLLQAGERRVNTQVISETLDNKETKLVVKETDCDNNTMPNLISAQPTLGSVVALNNITAPEHRLMLMGGYHGVLELMSFFKIKPDIKTFSQLLDQMPSTLVAEKDVLDAINKTGVQLDVDFCNMLIKKRCFRGDYKNAKDVLKIIQEKSLRPDIMTFGVLAMACQSESSAKQLLQDIDNVGFRPNIEILGTLLKNACYLRDCDFVMKVMKTLEQEDLKPNDKFLSHLDNFYRFSVKALSAQDTDNTGRLKQDRFKEYCQYYRSWRRLKDPEALPHPWDQFEQTHKEPEDEELMNYGKIKYVK